LIGGRVQLQQPSMELRQSSSLIVDADEDEDVAFVVAVSDDEDDDSKSCSLFEFILYVDGRIY
jgi:hypothetical protein